MSKYRVSAAEVGELDNHRFAWLGVAVVANEAAHCDEVLADVASVAANLPDAILNDRSTEIIPFGHAGSGVRGGIETRLLSDVELAGVDPRRGDGDDD